MDTSLRDIETETEQLTRFRRDLHRIPKLGFDAYKALVMMK